LETFQSDNFGIVNRISGLKPHEEFYQMGEEGNPPDAYELQTTSHMKRLIYRDYVISNKYPNNIVLTKDKCVCVVSDLSYDTVADSFNVTIVPFKKQGDFFSGIPCNSSDCDIYSVSGGIDYSKKRVINSTEVANQFVCLLNDREMSKQQQQQAPTTSSAAGTATTAAINRNAHWVCIPLMHAQFR
jgi:hypothetical protein